MKELTQIRGNFDEVASSKYYAGTTLQDDYLKVVLTDEDDIANMEKMLDKFNEDDDVNAVFTNWDN